MMMRVFAALKISHKLCLSSLTFALPIALLLYFMAAGINYDIHFARMEFWGNQVLQPLTDLLRLAPRHQLLTTLRQAGDRSVENELSAVAAQIQSAFADLERNTARFGQALQLDAESLRAVNLESLHASALRQQWTAIQETTPELTAPAYAALVQNLRGAISRVGDTSNLILDPDLDSYYLMDAVLLAIPQMHHRVSSLLVAGRQIVQHPQYDAADRTFFGIQAAMLKEADVGRIQQALETALREDRHFYGVSASLQNDLPPVLRRFTQDSLALIAALENVAQATGRNLSVSEFLAQGEQVLRSSAELWTISHRELDGLLERRIRSYQQTRLVYLASSLLALAAASLLTFLISHSITHRLRQVMAVTNTVANGDLTLSITPSMSRDEIGQLLTAIRGMLQNLNTLIRQIQHSIIKVSSSTAELAASTRQQNMTVKTQVSSTQHGLQFIEEITDVTKGLIETLQGMAAMAGNVTSERRGADLERMAGAMRHMEDASQTISTRLQVINKKAENITDMVTTITMVADQTNLLSLNAAIEAEKAGEYGRGFTVVAREIRRLADQTAIATLDIAEMVKEMQSAVASGVTDMETFTTDVRRSTEDVNLITTKLVQIITQLHALAPRFEDVKQAMADLDEGMHQTAESLTETFLAIGQLDEAAKLLQGEIERFKVE